MPENGWIKLKFVQICSIALCFSVLTSTPCFAAEADEDSIAAGRSSGAQESKDRNVFYLKPSLKQGGTKNGVLSFTDDVFQLNLRGKPYATVGDAKLAGRTDAFVGSLFASALVGLIASAFSDDNTMAFLLWGGGYFLISFPYASHQLTSTVRPGLSVNFKGKWVNPEPLGLEKVATEWRDLDAEMWESARARGSVEGYSDYLSKYPKGRHSKAALNNRETLAWEKAKRENTVESYTEYLLLSPQAHQKEALLAREPLTWERAKGEDAIDGYSKYLVLCPNGEHAKEALDRKEDLCWKEALATQLLTPIREYQEVFPGGKHSSAADSIVAAFEARYWKDAETSGEMLDLKRYLDNFSSTSRAHQAAEKILQNLKESGWRVEIEFAMANGLPAWDEALAKEVALERDMDEAESMFQSFILGALRRSGFKLMPEAENVIHADYDEHYADLTSMRNVENARVPTLVITTRHNVLVSSLKVTFNHRDCRECYTIALDELPTINKENEMSEQMIRRLMDELATVERGTDVQ